MATATYESLPQHATEEELGDEVELQDLSSQRRQSVSEHQDGVPKPSVTRLLVYFLINSFAIGITAVPRVNLIISLVCRHLLNSTPVLSAEGLESRTVELVAERVIIGGFNAQCLTSEVSSQTALFASYGTLIAGVLSAVMSTVLSKLSDHVGRVKIMIMSMIGLITSEILIVTVAGFPDIIDYRFYYLAYAADGISGSFATQMAMSSAYISDTKPESERNVQIGRIHGAMFIGIAGGPLISSYIIYLAGQENPLLVFYICLAMRLMSVIYLLFVPESLPLSLRKKAPFGGLPIFQSKSSRAWRAIGSRLNPVNWLERIVVGGVGRHRRFRANVTLLLAVNVIVYGGAMGTAELLVLYPQMIFKWSNVENNLFMAVTNAFRAAVAALALPLLVRMFRKGRPFANQEQSQPLHTGMGVDGLDRVLIRVAVLCDILGFVGYALAPNGVAFTLCGALAAFGAIGLSTTESALTKHVAPDRIGELMAGLGLLQAFVRIVAPSSVNLLYSLTVKTVPQATLLSMGAVLGVAFSLTAYLTVSSTDPSSM